MKSKKFLALAILAILTIVCVIALVACDETPDEHTCESKCPICEKCTNESCKEDACKDKCQGHEQPLLDYDMSGVTMTNKKVTYNGSEQTLTVSGTLPTGVTVAYEYFSGVSKLNNAPVNVGEYRVVAKFTGDKEHKAIDNMEATLTIEKATYDMTAVELADDALIFNGSEQTLVPTGLPAGVTTSYEYYDIEDTNKEHKLDGAPINVGVYTVVASFVGDDNHHEIETTLTATLTIVKATYDMSQVAFVGNSEVTYNGNAQTLTIDETKLPTGVTATIEYYQSESKLDSAPVNAGTYTVVAKFTGDTVNHHAIDDLTETLLINKANVNFPIVLGATTNAAGEPLRRYAGDESPIDRIVFAEKNGIYEACIGANNGHPTLVVTTYTVEVLDCSVEYQVAFYDALDKVGTADSIDAGRISALNDTVYMLLTFQNYNLVQMTVKGVHRVVEMDSYEDLCLMDTDIDNYPVDVRLATKYVLTDNVDLAGHVWQTVGTRLYLNDLGVFNTTFVSEFDGKGYTISNLTLNDQSVKEEYINDQAGIAFGFFGFVTDGRVHDVVFDTVTADISATRLSSPKYGTHAYHWGYTNRYLYFGVVAGRVNTSQKGETNSFYNITVKNLTANLVFPYGYIGTFFGFDGGNYPTDTVRSGLVAENINITAVEPLYLVMSATNWGTGDYMFVGGIVGWMNSIYALTYDKCSIDGLVMTLERDIDGLETLVDTIQGLVPATTAYLGNMGAYVGYHSNADRTYYPDAKSSVDKFTNCSLKNFQLKNRSLNPNLASGMFYRGAEYAPEGYSPLVIDHETCTREKSDSNYYYWYRAGNNGIDRWWCDYRNDNYKFDWGNDGVVD